MVDIKPFVTKQSKLEIRNVLVLFLLNYLLGREREREKGIGELVDKLNHDWALLYLFVLWFV